MKISKQIVLILILASLLLSAIGVSIFLYLENENSKNISNELVYIYVAKSNIKKNSLIKEKDLVRTKIAKKYLLNKVLLKRDIIDKFAKINIYKNETFIKEKIQKEKIIDKVSLIDYKNSSYNISFDLFSNGNLSLKKGDFINIVTVAPKSLKKENLKYNVQYIARAVKVLGFLDEGEIVEFTYRQVKQKVKTKNKKDKVTYEMVRQYADELVIDIKEETILSLLTEYNKGKQLWMVKVKEPIIKKEKKKKKVIKKRKKYVKKLYPFKLYKSKNSSVNKTAVIEYIDEDIPSYFGKTTLSNNVESTCINSDKYLIGISRNVYLKTRASTKARTKKRIYKNFIIPYKNELKNWYEVCDGTYVHKNEVKKIDAIKALGLINAK